MGITVYSLLWVMQDFVHQPNDPLLEQLPMTGGLVNADRVEVKKSLNSKPFTKAPDPRGASHTPE